MTSLRVVVSQTGSLPCSETQLTMTDYIPVMASVEQMYMVIALRSTAVPCNTFPELRMTHIVTLINHCVYVKEQIRGDAMNLSWS